MKIPLSIVAVFWLVSLLPQAGLADECASNGPKAAVDVPKNGRKVPQNVRFRVGLFHTCGGIEGGPEHRFRVVDERGVEAVHKRYFWTDYFLEVTPAEALKPGGWRVQVRRPVSAEKLGDWETLASVKVEKGLDLTPPAFGGIRQAEAKAVAGMVLLSPCEAKTDWVVRTTIRLAPAKDDHSTQSELIYALDRRANDQSKWTQFRTFRPTEDRRFSFESDWAWGQIWEYRLRVRDMAGNQTVGEAISKVHNPSRPPGPPPAIRSQR